MRHAVWYLGDYVRSFKYEWMANLYVWFNSGVVLYGQPGYYEVLISEGFNSGKLCTRTEILKSSCYKEIEWCYSEQEVLKITFLGEEYNCCKKGTCNVVKNTIS